MTMTQSMDRIVDMLEWFEETRKIHSGMIRSKIKKDANTDSVGGYAWGCVDRKIREMVGIPQRMGTEKSFSYFLKQGQVVEINLALKNLFEAFKKAEDGQESMNTFKEAVDICLGDSQLRPDQPIVQEVSVVESTPSIAMVETKQNEPGEDGGHINTIDAGKALHGTIVYNSSKRKKRINAHLMIIGGKKVVCHEANGKTFEKTPSMAIVVLDGTTMGTCGKLNVVLRDMHISSDPDSWFLKESDVGRFSEIADKIISDVPAYQYGFADRKKIQTITGNSFSSEMQSEIVMAIQLADSAGYDAKLGDVIEKKNLTHSSEVKKEEQKVITHDVTLDDKSFEVEVSRISAIRALELVRNAAALKKEEAKSKVSPIKQEVAKQSITVDIREQVKAALFAERQEEERIKSWEANLNERELKIIEEGRRIDLIMAEKMVNEERIKVLQLELIKLQGQLTQKKTFWQWLTQ